MTTTAICSQVGHDPWVSRPAREPVLGSFPLPLGTAGAPGGRCHPTQSASLRGKVLFPFAKSSLSPEHLQQLAAPSHGVSAKGPKCPHPSFCTSSRQVSLRKYLLSLIPREIPNDYIFMACTPRAALQLVLSGQDEEFGNVIRGSDRAEAQLGDPAGECLSLQDRAASRRGSRLLNYLFLPQTLIKHLLDISPCPLGMFSQEEKTDINKGQSTHLSFNTH